MKCRIAIDLIPIRVGAGGTGSGIWTYARELLRHMDEEDFHGLEIVALVNKGQIPFLSNLQNIRLIRIPDLGKNSVIRLLWIHLFLPLVCLILRVDILHKLATETPLLCPARRVTTVHDFYYEFLMENHPAESIRLYERLENFYFSLTTRTCFSKSRAIIAVSDTTRQEAVQRYPKSEERIQVIHHGASPKAPYEVRLEYRDSNEAVTPKPESSSFTILCVAKFMEHKGQYLLIEAFETLMGLNPDLAMRLHLNLRGFHNDEGYYDLICKKVSGSRFSGNMHLLPYNADEGLVEIYANTDLVVLLSSYEGFGLPVLEAQGMGIPVLCSDLLVLQEVGGEGAVYVQRDDRMAVAKAMQQFVEGPEYYETIRSLALANTGRFCWSEAARKTIEIYRAV